MPNVHEQLEPAIVGLALELSKNRLKEIDFPYFNNPLREQPKTVVIFVIGGIDFAEAKCFADLNSKNRDCFFVAGGSSIVTSNSFIEDLKENRH